MSSRSVRGRLDRLGSPTAAADGPVCRNHGQACAMGRNWPQPYEHGQEDELIEFVTDAHRRLGRPTKPTRRERWAIHEHERVPDAELREEEREAAELLAALKTRNERVEAAWRAGDVDYWEPH
jgi:hypothetical protein